MHIANSTRPASISKAESDLVDIKYLLDWLAGHNEKVDFGYYAQFAPKDRLLPGFRQLYRELKSRRGRLQSVLQADDFQYVSS